MADRIRTGIIGLGRSGRQIHAKCLAESPLYSITAVADAEAERLEGCQETWGCKTYNDWRKLLGDDDVELAVIATASASHCEITLEALRAGKAVVVDKPMAVTVAEADSMIAEAERTGCLLTVFQNRRFDGDFLAVRETIESGILGPVQFIRRGVYNYSRRADWQTVRKFGGGMLNNWGAHILDQLLILMNYEVADVFGDARNTLSAGDAEDHAVVVLVGESMAAQMDVFSCCGFPQPQWLVLGKYGSLTGGGEKFQVKYCDPKSLPPLPGVDEIPPAAGEGYGGEEIAWQEKTVEARPSNNAKAFYDRLYDSIRKGAPLAVKPKESREVVRVIERVKEQVARRSG